MEMNAYVSMVALWSFAVFLSTVFSALLVGVTLEARFKKTVTVAAWIVASFVGYIVLFLAYLINLYNDAMGVLGMAVIVCAVSVILYKGTISSKLFVALMVCLIANVVTFMFCGTTDSLLAGNLGLIQESPYEIPNIMFFAAVKLVVFTICFVLYFKFLRKYLQGIVETLAGSMKHFVIAPLISIIGFYFINLFTNQNGIFPSNLWFFPLYFTICMIFVVEFVLIFFAVMQNALAMQNQAELNVANNIQQSMLPRIFPAFPDRAEFDIYATMDPAKEVGGDFYDFFMVDNTHLAIVVADVSGKGVPAALFMTIGKLLLKNHTQIGKDLGEVFAEVNDLLCESNSEGLFITAFEGVLDLVTGDFTYVNAGHEIPYICRGDGKFAPYEVPAAFVLAGMEGMFYQSGSMKLEPGDKIFQYTDGVTEATNLHNELYGDERLEAILARNSDKTPQEILPAVKDDIDRFVGSAPQFDDITMLCLAYNKYAEAQ